MERLHEEQIHVFQEVPRREVWVVVIRFRSRGSFFLNAGAQSALCFRIPMKVSTGTFARCTRLRLNAKAEISAAMSWLSASLSEAADPTGPTSWGFSTERTEQGLPSIELRLRPPTMINNVPAVASAMLPSTGASQYDPSASSTAAVGQAFVRGNRAHVNHGLPAQSRQGLR